MRARIGSKHNSSHLVEEFSGLFLRQFDFDTDVAGWRAENAAWGMAGVALHLRRRIASGTDGPLADPGVIFALDLEAHGVDGVNVMQATDGGRHNFVAGLVRQ